MKNFLKRTFGINSHSKIDPETPDQLPFVDLNRVEAENESDSTKTYESNQIKEILDLLADDDYKKAKLSIENLSPKSLKEFNAEDAGVILAILLEKKELQAAQDFISKIDASNLPENTHFVILRIISDLQNSLSSDESLQILTSLIDSGFNAGACIDSGFNAGACDTKNKVDVLKIFSDQSKNPARLESNRALIKKLIETGKVKGYDNDNPGQAGILSDIAQKVIQGIDDKTLILGSPH